MNQEAIFIQVIRHSKMNRVGGSSKAKTRSQSSKFVNLFFQGMQGSFSCWWNMWGRFIVLTKIRKCIQWVPKFSAASLRKKRDEQNFFLQVDFLPLLYEYTQLKKSSYERPGDLFGQILPRFRELKQMCIFFIICICCINRILCIPDVGM